MVLCYGLYYYNAGTPFAANVKLVLLSTDLNKIKHFVKENFKNITPNVKNSIAFTCKGMRCIGWVSKYTMDEYIKDVGLTCDQPYDSINIIDLCKED